MKSLAKFIVRVADLMEAEGRALRQSSISVGLAIALALGAAVVGVGGLALVTWGLFESLKSAISIIGAAFLSGLFLLACAGALVWTVIKLSKGQ